MNYSELTKTQLIQLAKERGIARYSVIAKEKGKQPMIDLLKENDRLTQKTWTVAKPETKLELINIPTPEEFKGMIELAKDRLTITSLCNQLLDKLAENYTIPTVSKKLSSYKKLLYSYQSTNPKLNETVTTKKGSNTQTIAANLLKLSDEQSKELSQSRLENNAAKLGLDEEGEVRDVNMPPKDIKNIVEESCKLLSSTDVASVACGVMVLTGVRSYEQGVKKALVESEIIEREWLVVGEFLIAIKGIAKKGTDTNWYVRPTLAPAKLIVDAQNRYWNSAEVKNLTLTSSGFDKSGLKKAISRKFKTLFGEKLATIEGYDDNGKLIDANGSPHKARGFYVQALTPVLKNNGLNLNHIKMYVQKSLAHTLSGVTQKYFDRYDENQFIEPIAINIPTSMKKIGLMPDEIVRELNQEFTPKTTQESNQETEETMTTQTKTDMGIDLDVIAQSIDSRLKPEFQRMLNEGFSPTEALIKIIETAQNTPPKEDKQPPVSEKIEEIIVAILEYNENQPEIENILYPSYTVCNRISKEKYGKEIARKTYDDVWKLKGRDITEKLENRGIPNISRNEAKSQGVVSQEMWNSKYHRKDTDEIVSRIVDIL